MFGKKLINVLFSILAVVLIIQLALSLVMFVWGYFAPPQLPPELVKVIQAVAGFGQVVFIYVVVATLRHLYAGAKK